MKEKASPTIKLHTKTLIQCPTKHMVKANKLSANKVGDIKETKKGGKQNL